MLRWPSETLRLDSNEFVWQANSALAAAVALIFGYYGILQFKVYPGTKATSYVLPSLIASYGILALIFFFARMDYSRYMFLMSFAARDGVVLRRHRAAEPTREA